jgi:CBS domain-containing protein
MTENVITVDWLLPLEEFVENYIYKHQFRNFPVFNREELVGMAAMDGANSVARDLWIFKQVRDIMVPIENVVCVRPTDDASEVLKKMVLDDTGSFPVIDGEKMVGIVSRTDITNL